MRTPLSVHPRFFKAHGHGNDYLVFEEGAGPSLTTELIRRICDRWRGPGADGLVVVESTARGAETRLRMFNPDGGEFERSGNGLRIAGVYMKHLGRAGDGPFFVTVGGDRIRLEVAGPDAQGVYDARADMGRITFPTGPPFVARARVNERGRVALKLMRPSGGRGRGGGGAAADVVEVVPVAVGNPHAVAFRRSWARSEVEHYGPMIGTSEAFPRGANVQFADAPAGREIAIRIWERGVGPTSASGTSACAAASAAVRLGLVPAGPVTVRMEGGAMEVDVDPDWTVRLRGPVEEVCFGEFAPGFLKGRGTPGQRADST
ncbi:MAG: diaminopimelate epimerase [Gemmatimonadetes bacterium]|nr:diaminopimelate epimerase [Gemmatimonadota bacterium]